MPLLPRTARPTLLDFARQYPALVVTGPRQSGRTTLTRLAFPEKPYASLEDPDTREFAESDPRAFLDYYPDGAILDEAQRCPALFSYLQSRLDRDGRMGLFILSGSQQFDLLAGITQSLAGRVARIPLLPFSIGELTDADRLPGTLEALLWQGLYPPVYDRRLEPGPWYGNYVASYIERDVRQLINVRDLGAFQRFLRMCAARCGQLLNLSGLASDCGITHNTAKAWISVLEASYIVHLLQPHHENFNKRLVKSPKLYFLDPGLAAWLLGIRDARQLATHSARGALFETLVVAEMLKSYYNRGRESSLYFWRDSRGTEVDLLIDRAGELSPVEIKSAKTIAGDFFAGLKKFARLAGDRSGRGTLIYGGDDNRNRTDYDVIGWRNLQTIVGDDD